MRINLTKKQEKLHDEIEEICKKNGLMKKRLKPIYDGVGDITIYEKSKLKVMWILKEAYDKDKKGNIGNGGWNTYDCFEAEKIKDSCKILTFKRMAYIMYGFNHYEEYDKPKTSIYTALPNISKPENQKELMRELAGIAYININKMPSGTRSSDSAIRESYGIWGDLIKKQIETYNPDVIILGGTEKFLRFLERAKKIEKDFPVYEKDERYFISVYHPAQTTMSVDDYVNLVINSLKKVEKRNKDGHK